MTKCGKDEGKNYYIEVQHGNPVGGKWSQEQVKESETTPCPLLGVSQTHQANNLNIYVEDLAQTHAGYMIAASVSLGP